MDDNSSNHFQPSTSCIRWQWFNDDDPKIIEWWWPQDQPQPQWGQINGSPDTSSLPLPPCSDHRPHLQYIALSIHYEQCDFMNKKWNTFNKTQWLKIVTVFQCDLKPRTKAVHPKLRDNCTHYKRWCCICICVCIFICIWINTFNHEEDDHYDLDVEEDGDNEKAGEAWNK